MHALRVWGTVFTLLPAWAELTVAQQLSFSDSQWKLRGDSTRVETFDGRQVLSMETGAAERSDVKLEDGTLDLDVMTSRRRSFVYVAFRAQNDGEYEEFY